MKSLLLALALITPALAVGFDNESFGQRLNGWKKDRTAVYDFTDAQYRTHQPTITKTPGGGMYISTQVDLLVFGGQGAISHIDMTFSSGGTLLSAQLRTTISRKIINTGLVRRPEALVPPVAIEGQPAPVVTPFDATSELIIDLFSRFSNKNAKSANLPAGLRHNVNLMLQSITSGGSGYYTAK